MAAGSEPHAAVLQPRVIHGDPARQRALVRHVQPVGLVTVPRRFGVRVRRFGDHHVEVMRHVRTKDSARNKQATLMHWTIG